MDVRIGTIGTLTSSGRAAGARLSKHQAFPTLLGALAIWLAVGFVGNGSFIGTLRAAASVGAFLALAGLGQMFVIAIGNGNIDLSVPYVLTLSAYIASSLINGNAAATPIGVLAVLGVGFVVGVVNALAIIYLRVPPIVATLAVGFVVESAYLELSSQVHGGLGTAINVVATGTVGGVPYMAIVAVVWAVVVQLLLTRSWFGRQLLALGQSRSAAELVGVRARRLTFAVYVICAVTAAVVGLLLGGYIGGGSLDMGTSYQLGSIAVVVLGGCLVSGGVANTPGILAASVFVSLLVTLTNLLHVDAGVQQIIEGGIIVGLLASVGKERVRVV